MEKHRRTIFAVLLIAIMLLPMGSMSGKGGDADIGSNIPSRAAPQYKGIKYAIITTEQLARSFEPLKEWRSQTGLRSEIFTIDGPGSVIEGIEGRDPAERLFNFISSLYEDSEGSLEYVLLGGDSDIIPVRYLHANASRWGYDDDYLSDVYYSSPSTPWDLDGDGIYGEREDIEAFGVENLSFPLKVGRFPVDTIEESSRMVTRLIDYESSPEEGNWTERGVISSSLMDRPNIPDDPETPEDEGFNAYKDNAYKAFANYTLRYIPRSLDIIQAHDYERYEGGFYNLSVDHLDDSTLPTLISNGCSFFTFAGQSFYDVDAGNSPPLAYSLAHYRVDSGTVPGASGYGLALTYEDVWNLSNGNRLPVVYISSCDSANFSDPGDRSLEGLVYAPDGGAICFIGSTGVSWRGEGEDYSLGNWYLISRFWDRMMLTNRPGDSLYWLKQDYVRTKWGEFATKEVFLIELYTYNFMGDPALRAWIGEPAVVRIQNTSSEHYAGGDTFDLRVTNRFGSPVANAEVTFYLNTTGEVFSSVTGPDGRAAVSTSFSSGGTGKITVTGRNIIPEVMEVTISDQPMDLYVDGDSLGLAPLPLTEGAEARLSVNVSNIGGRDAVSVRVVVVPEQLTTDPLDWPEPVSEIVMDLAAAETRTLEFLLQPFRSWAYLSVGIVPPEGEINIENNVGTLKIDVNARPRFLSTGILEMQEDQEGGGTFDLSEMVYDPDNDPVTLVYGIGTGAPDWCRIEGHILFVNPPVNWSGTFDVPLRVSDLLSQDTRTVTIFVSPVNDPPSLSGLESNYELMVDRPFTLVMRTVDAEGEAVRVSVASDLEGLEISGNTLRFLPYPDDVGVHNVSLHVSDPSGGNMTYNITFTILPNSGNLYFQEPSVHLPDAKVGREFRYTIRIGGDLSKNATFSDDSPLFEIDETTGEIHFTPSSSDTGEHWVTITVRAGNETVSRTFLLKIVEPTERDMTILWILGIVAALLLAGILLILLWRGPQVEQYGLEE